MRPNQQINKKIVETLRSQADYIEPSTDLFNKIKLDLYKKEQEEMMNTTRFSLKNRKKVLVTGFLCLALTSITIMGATFGKSWVGSTTTKYMQFPEKESIQQDIGFAPKYTEQLPGGFVYKMGGVGTSELLDESENVVTRAKTVTFSYGQDDNNMPLSLHVEEIQEQYVNYEGSELVDSYKEIGLYYNEQLFKFVPESYELTDEDKQAVEKGTMALSVGTPEVSVEHYQMLTWYENGLKYSIGGFDCNFTIEEMVEMAQTIISEE